jgi:hypothetical protein
MRQAPVDLTQLSRSHNPDIQDCARYFTYLRDEIERLYQRQQTVSSQVPQPLSATIPQELDRRIEQVVMQHQTRVDYDEIDRRIQSAIDRHEGELSLHEIDRRIQQAIHEDAYAYRPQETNPLTRERLLGILHQEN